MAAPLKWFPMYVDELQNDEAYRLMTPEERGIFLDLLCWQWRETSIPADEQKLRDGLGLKVRYYGALARVLKNEFMANGKPGRLTNPKLAEVYVEQIGRSDRARTAALAKHRGRTHGA